MAASWAVLIVQGWCGYNEGLLEGRDIAQQWTMGIPTAQHNSEERRRGKGSFRWTQIRAMETINSHSIVRRNPVWNKRLSFKSMQYAIQLYLFLDQALLFFCRSSLIWTGNDCRLQVFQLLISSLMAAPSSTPLPAFSMPGTNSANTIHISLSTSLT